MISFLWVHRDQSVAKIVCQSVSQRNVPPLRDCQNASSEVTTRRSTPASCHTAWARGQVKDRCEQSSTALAHNEHSTGESGTMRCRRDLIIRRCRSKSQANTLIFRGRRRFHTKRHLCRRIWSFNSPWSRSNMYAARTVKLRPLHTHASWATSDKRWSARSSSSLSSSSTHWSDNTSGNAGAHALCHARCTEIPGSVDNA